MDDRLEHRPDYMQCFNGGFYSCLIRVIKEYPR